MHVDLERAMLAAAAGVPAISALLHAENVAGAAHDGGVIRAVGLGYDGPWHSLDAWVASPFLLLPVGTTVFRAAVASAVVCGLAGAVLYRLIRGLLAACASSPRLGPLVAAIASVTATSTIAWQIEALAPGGATLGACLALLALLPGIRAEVAVFFCATALVYDPWAGAGAGAGLLAAKAMGWLERRAVPAPSRAFALSLTALVPFLLARLRIVHSPFVSTGTWLGERGAPSKPLLWAYSQLGWLALGLAGVGLAVAFFYRGARPMALALVLTTAMGAGALALGVPAGPGHFAPVTLLGIAALAAFAGVAMQTLVRTVAAARVPLASASAAMIVLLEIAFPVALLDDASIRCEAHTRAARVPWHEAAFGELPARPLLLTQELRFLEHAYALRASGLLRTDLALLDISDLNAHRAARELSREPALAPFFRDMSLTGAPSEWALTTLANARPLALFFQPAWDRAIARHLLARGPLDVFHAEPRSGLERKRALEAFQPLREQLSAMLASPESPELRALTAAALSARAQAITAARDKDLSIRADDDLRSFLNPPTPLRNSDAAPTR